MEKEFNLSEKLRKAKLKVVNREIVKSKNEIKSLEKQIEDFKDNEGVVRVLRNMLEVKKNILELLYLKFLYLNLNGDKN